MQQGNGRVVTLFALALMLAHSSGCASTRLSPVRDARFVPEDDERSLWEQSAKLDTDVQERGLVYEDARLQQHIDTVARRTLAHMAIGEPAVRVRVIKDPFLNAFALPNGTIYLHTGILARMDNDAQLATVLGHELSHFLQRHSLQQQRTARNRRVTMQVVLGVLVVAAAGLSGDPSAARLLLDLAGPASETLVTVQVKGYSRDLEREADEQSLKALIAAGYDGGEARKTFERLLEQEREAGVAEPYFFGSHPSLEERIQNCDELIAAPSTAAVTTALGEAAFADAISSLLLDNADLDMKLLRMHHARMAVEKHLAHNPASARGHCLLGDVHRRSDDEEATLAAAARAYQDCARLDPGFADAHRELGLIYRSQGRLLDALRELERYAELAPGAVDQPIVRTYIEELGRAGGTQR